jgi:hypothetical protein
VIDERRKFQENMPIIEIGDYVKSTFKRADGATEHMWIEVKNIGNETFTGALANDPIIVNMNSFKIRSLGTSKSRMMRWIRFKYVAKWFFYWYLSLGKRRFSNKARYGKN